MDALSTTPTTFEKNPLTLKGKKLTVHLDVLNAALEPYKLRVDALDDISFDTDFPENNVLKILTVYTGNDTGGWDEGTANWFFEEIREMEDRFEETSAVVSAADFDRGNKVLTLSLNKKNLELIKTFAKGGTFNDGDSAIVLQVDNYLQNSPQEIFKMLGIDKPETQEKLDAMLSEVKDKAIAHLKSQRPKPVMAFFQGKKIDLGLGASSEALYIQQALFNKIFNFAMTHLNGAQNETFASEYASNKAIIAMDLIRGMATHKGLPVFYIDDALLDDAVEKTLSTASINQNQ